MLIVPLLLLIEQEIGAKVLLSHLYLMDLLVLLTFQKRFSTSVKLTVDF